MSARGESWRTCCLVGRKAAVPEAWEVWGKLVANNWRKPTVFSKAVKDPPPAPRQWHVLPKGF